jgi:hypothetical protein
MPLTPSRIVTVALVVTVGLSGITAAHAGQSGEPGEERTPVEQGPEDGPLTLDAWPDGGWVVELTGSFSGQTPNGAADLDAASTLGIDVSDGTLVGATPFVLQYLGEGQGEASAGGLSGTADIRFEYRGDVTADEGRVELQAREAFYTLDDLEVNGVSVDWPAQTLPVPTRKPLTVTSAGCGLVEGTWRGDFVEGLDDAGMSIVEDRTPTFRAVSDDVDPDWLAEAERISERIASLGVLSSGTLGQLLTLVVEAESVAADASRRGDCGDSFSLGVAAAVEAKLLAFLEVHPDLSAAELWPLAHLISRAGILPGTPAHAALGAALGRSIDLLAPGDVAGAIDLLQVALALGDTVAVTRLQQRIGDPGGQVPGTWLPGR